METITVAGCIGSSRQGALPDGTTVVMNFSVAVDDSYVDKTTGEVVKQTNWYNCALYRGQGRDKVFQFLQPGTYVTVTGKPAIDAYYSEKDKAMKASIKIDVNQLTLQGSSQNKNNATETVNADIEQQPATAQ